MAVTESEPMFLKAVDCSDEIKDKDYVAKQIRDVIREVGLSNVVQIVTDNAPVCKATGLLIEAELLSVFLDSLCCSYSQPYFKGHLCN
ncbi:hypothetical protein S83_022796 [Arachis hypogaea]